jgi:hypothetical protein
LQIEGNQVKATVNGIPERGHEKPANRGPYPEPVFQFKEVGRGLWVRTRNRFGFNDRGGNYWLRRQFGTTPQSGLLKLRIFHVTFESSVSDASMFFYKPHCAHPKQRKTGFSQTATILGPPLAPLPFLTQAFLPIASAIVGTRQGFYVYFCEWQELRLDSVVIR